MALQYSIPSLPLKYDFETVPVLRNLARANRALAELKGIAATIPNENILISSLTLQEARDSSSIENIITTQDDFYKAELQFKSLKVSAATKEVQNYREAIYEGFRLIRENKLLTNNTIIRIQNCLKHSDNGFRNTPGTKLVREDGVVIYEPPQDFRDIVACMDNLETFINDPSFSDLDPLIKMAIIHHQFESIHPFTDGNGRTGRIINILYLVINGLLELPILYLSRFITRNKSEYYQLIQAIRDKEGDNSSEWEKWIIFILQGIEETALETITIVKGISSLMADFKEIIKPAFGSVYRHELLNNLFFHPYTKIEFVCNDMSIQRKTAAKYLDKIVELALLKKVKYGRENYYINTKLTELFLNIQ
ncbi:MAG: Fic family protein [Prevotellaceae bacterium]|nr:Fic family protein [Prevotellaceae bacterium]